MFYHFASLSGVALIAAGLLILLVRPLDEKFVGVLAVAGGFALVALNEVTRRPRRKRAKRIASGATDGHDTSLQSKS